MGADSLSICKLLQEVQKCALVLFQFSCKFTNTCDASGRSHSYLDALILIKIWGWGYLTCVLISRNQWTATEIVISQLLGLKYPLGKKYIYVVKLYSGHVMTPTAVDDLQW